MPKTLGCGRPWDLRTRTQASQSGTSCTFVGVTNSMTQGTFRKPSPCAASKAAQSRTLSARLAG
eukprot:12497299-Heterocapsa_arctica.AAC.1